MSHSEEKYVFVSYVREDDAEVDGLCRVLEAASIPYWRDKTSLGPGDAWRAKIREAIRDGALVFLACFSENTQSKSKSYMNEELTLAVDEFRRLPPGRTWLIPVRLDDVGLPGWDLGAGRSLSDLNYVDLFGDRYAPQAARLVTSIHQLMGRKQLSPAAALEAVDKATHADRANLMKRLTKDLLLDPTRRIELDDLVSQEAERIRKAMSDPARMKGPIGDTGAQQVECLATEAQDLLETAMPFYASLQVAAQWGRPDTLAAWRDGIRDLVQLANKSQEGVAALADLRHVPGMAALMVAGLASTAAQRWDNLKKLTADSWIRDPFTPERRPVLEMTDPYRPFQRQAATPHVLAHATQGNTSITTETKNLDKGLASRFQAPTAEWLYRALRPIFQDQLPDEDNYTTQFDRAEVMLGVLGEDAINVRLANHPQQACRGRSHWFGRSSWRANHGYGNAVEDLRLELAVEGANWEPLRQGLFGGEPQRAKTALEDYAESFDKVGW